MKQPPLPLWNADHSDVLPEFRLTFGHALFQGVFSEEICSQLCCSLDCFKPVYVGPMRETSIPKFQQIRSFNSSSEIHFLFARSNDVWAAFGPHEFFFTTKKWMVFNRKFGGVMAFSTQMDIKSFSYLIFKNGKKQTNAFSENGLIRIIPDDRVSAYIGKEKIYEDKSSCSISDLEIQKFIDKDLLIKNTEGKLSIESKSNNSPADEIVHFIFPKKPSGFWTKIGAKFKS